MIELQKLNKIIDDNLYTLHVCSKEKTFTFKINDFKINCYNIEFKNSNVCLCLSLNNFINIDFDESNNHEYIKIKLRDGDIIKLIKRV